MSADQPYPRPLTERQNARLLLDTVDQRARPVIAPAAVLDDDQLGELAQAREYATLCKSRPRR